MNDDDYEVEVEETLTPEQERLADLIEQVQEYKMAMAAVSRLVLPIIRAWRGTTDESRILELLDENCDAIRAYLDPDYMDAGDDA